MKSNFYGLRKLVPGILASAACVLLPALSQAQANVSINFNDVLPGSGVNTQYQSTLGVTFSPIPNLPIYNPVIADNPGLPVGPTSADNALIGIFSAIQLSLDPGMYPTNFSAFAFDVIPDPLDTNGLSAATVLFLDQNGLTVNSLTIDQTVAGSYNFAGLPQFSAVILPADADYDNLTVTPEPGSFLLLGAFTATAAGLRWKRRRRA